MSETETKKIICGVTEDGRVRIDNAFIDEDGTILLGLLEWAVLRKQANASVNEYLSKLMEELGA